MQTSSAAVGRFEMGAPTPEQHRRAAGWFTLAHMSAVRAHPWLEKLTLALFAVCIIGQLWVLQGNIRDSAQSIPCPVTYPAPWQTDRHRYHAGDVIRFAYQRESTEANLILWQIDSWENADTGELYPGAFLGRHVGRVGAERVRQVRDLPPRMSPGTYRLRGWISAQTSRRSLPVEYVSEPFEVLGR